MSFPQLSLFIIEMVTIKNNITCQNILSQRYKDGQVVWFCVKEVNLRERKSEFCATDLQSHKSLIFGKEGCVMRGDKNT